MKRIILLLFVVITIMACDSNTDPTFAIYGRSGIVQCGYSDTARFVPLLWVSNTTLENFKEVKVNSTSTYKYEMQKYSNYTYTSKLDTIENLAEMLGTYVIRASSESGKVVEQSFTYKTTDLIQIGEFRATALQYTKDSEGCLFSAEITKAENAAAYGFSLTVGTLDANNNIQYLPINTSYSFQTVVFEEGKTTCKIGLRLTSSLLPTNNYRLAVLAKRGDLSVEGQYIYISKN